MKSWKNFKATLLCVVMLSAVLPVCAQSAIAPVFPGRHWERVTSPEAAGYSAARLAAVTERLHALDTTAMMVVSGGRVLLEYGDTAYLSYLASARKSVLTMLFGGPVTEGTIRLDRTLADIGFDDIEPLSAIERRATIENLLTARSGIYHPAANRGDDTAHAPARGSVIPGSVHLYNNWDFNAAGAIYEQLTGRDIYDMLEIELSRSLGFEDFDRDRQRKTGDLSRSRHLAYHMTLSTRDMARLGLLMLRGGRWNGVQVLPEGWSARITSLVTPHDALLPDRKRRIDAAGERWGYGWMWWVWDAARPEDPMAGAYSARGLGGQFIVVIPGMDLVIAHKTDLRAGGVRRRVSAAHFAEVLRLLIAARCGKSGCPEAVVISGS